MLSDSSYRNQPRRTFSREFKRDVVELLQEEAATVAEIAREYELHPNQLMRWRKEYLRGAYGAVVGCVKTEPALLPVELIDAVRSIEVAPSEVKAQKPRASVPTSRVRRLRIVLSKGEMHLEDVDRETLGLLIEALQ